MWNLSAWILISGQFKSQRFNTHIEKEKSYVTRQVSLSLHDTLFCFSSRTSSSTAFFFLLLHDARSRKNQLKRLVPRVDRINEVSAKATDHRASNYTWMAMIKRVFDEAEEKRRRGEARRRWTGRWKGIFRVRFEITILSNSFLCVGSMDWWGRVTDDEIVGL